MICDLFFYTKNVETLEETEASWEKLQKSEGKEVVQERVNIQQTSFYTDQH